MGKLVLAIAAVLLLQIAFFRYLAVSDQEHATSPVVRSRKFSASEESPLPAKQSQPAEPETVPDALSTERAESVDKKRAIPPQTARRTIRASSERRPSGLQVRGEILKPTIIYVKPTEPYVERNVARVRGERVTTRDFKMALPENSPAVASAHAKAANPRKRSFLARTFMPLVRKPWRFMKSVASKLH